MYLSTNYESRQRMVKPPHNQQDVESGVLVLLALMPAGDAGSMLSWACAPASVPPCPRGLSYLICMSCTMGRASAI